MAKSRARKSSPWGAIAVLGAVAAGVGVIALAVNASAKPATPAPPSPVPVIPPIPSIIGSALLTPITDPTLVRLSQAAVAEAFSSATSVRKLGLTPADYTMADVDGNPNSPRFMRAVAALQNWFNPQLTQAILAGGAKLPPGYPTQLRTDGVLDGATAWAIANALAG